MCSLMEHSERSYREEKARQAQDPKGSFFTPKPGRIGSLDWIVQRGDTTTAVYNINYFPDGNRSYSFDNPWSVVAPSGNVAHFTTHAEALAWAFKENK